MVSAGLGSVVVIDSGAHTVKAGYAGEQAPRSVIPCVVGVPRNNGVVLATGDKEFYVGEQAQEKRGMLSMNIPVSCGEVVSWVDIERLWNHTFYNELKIEPEAHPVILAEVALNTMRNREKATEIMFESFALPGLYIAVSSVLSLYSSGQTTGLVVDSGRDITMTVPIFEGYTLTRHIMRSKIAGQAVTQYLNALLMERGYNFTTVNEMDIVNYMKENVCYTAPDYVAALQRTRSGQEVPIKYPLPDGQDILLNEERFRCTEVMFDPTMYNADPKAIGLDKMCFESIGKCDADIRKEMYRYMMLSGGNTLFTGVGQRIQLGIQGLYKAKFPNEPMVPTKVVENVERMYATWLGGSMLGVLPMFHKMWISKADYNEHGPGVVHTKCF
eukprot:GGOE01065372.1.p1 GENE.GGOE01065372.1~~GGOE01065372.1.p1  ORF type:complete len:386 (+),score=98.19 GGOE01065372.1:110-1267(+)